MDVNVYVATFLLVMFVWVSVWPPYFWNVCVWPSYVWKGVVGHSLEWTAEMFSTISPRLINHPMAIASTCVLPPIFFSRGLPFLVEGSSGRSAKILGVVCQNVFHYSPPVY